MALIEIEVAHRQGDFPLDLGFASDAAVTALFGRSGAGKTTLVNLLAGLIRPQRGRIAIAGRTLVDTVRRLFVPAHRRQIGYVFQEGRLFPHLTVRQNLLYGRWLTPRPERYGSLEETIELLGIGHLLTRRPANLSGGEKQRVAIGRALLSSPRLLLMDEPLASLDVQRKAEIMPYLERLRDELRIPMIYVSHSIDEVARLADLIVVLADGRIVGSGAPVELLARSDLAGETGGVDAGAVLTCRVGARLTAFGMTLLEHPAGAIRVPEELPTGAAVRLRIRARDVVLARGAVAGLSVRNRLRATVMELTPCGTALVDVRLAVAHEQLLARITREAAAELALEPGLELTALVKTAALGRGPEG